MCHLVRGHFFPIAGFAKGRQAQTVLDGRVPEGAERQVHQHRPALSKVTRALLCQRHVVVRQLAEEIRIYLDRRAPLRNLIRQGGGCGHCTEAQLVDIWLQRVRQFIVGVGLDGEALRRFLLGRFEIAEVEPGYRDRAFGCPDHARSAWLGLAADLLASGDNLQPLGQVERHVEVRKATQRFAARGIPALSRSGLQVVHAVAVAPHRVLAVVLCQQTQRLPGLQGLRKHHRKLRIVVFVLLHEVQRQSVLVVHAANAQRRIEVQLYDTQPLATRRQRRFGCGLHLS